MQKKNAFPLRLSADKAGLPLRILHFANTPSTMRFLLQYLPGKKT
jgi:hypothetical protein